MKTTNTESLPMHTATFQAANGYQEVYHCSSWEQFHRACQVMESRGFALATWIDRSK